MSLVFRFLWSSLVVGLLLSNLVFAQLQSLSSPDEAAMRALAEKYFARYAAKDLDGLLKLWSVKSPEFAAQKKSTSELFANSEKITLKSFAVRQVRVLGNKARVRVEADLQVSEAKTNKEKPGFGKLQRTLELVKEEGTWKVWDEASTFDVLAVTLAAPQTEAEQARLLAEEQEWVHSELVRALNAQGNRFFEQGNFSQALALYRLGQKLAKQLGDGPGLARALNGLGNIHWAQGNYVQAFEHLQQSLAVSKRLGDQVAVAGTLRNLGNLQYVQGNWEQAAEMFRQGLQLSESLGDWPGMARGLGSLGVIADSQGNFAQALVYYKQCLKQFEALEDNVGTARTLGNIAIVYEEQGNYTQALAYHQKSLTLFEAKGDKVGSARTLHNIAVVQLDQGNYAQALDYSQRSLRLRESLGDKAGIARTLDLLGNIHSEQSKYAQALEYYQQSLALRRGLNDKEGIANILNSIGGIQAEQGHYTQALENIRQSLALCEEMGFKVGMTTALGFLSRVYQLQGQHKEALDTASRAAAVARQIGDINRLRQVQFTAGLSHRALKDFVQARLAFEEAITHIEALRANIAGGEEEQQRFFASKVAPYQAMTNLLVAEGQPMQALALAERAKARVLLDVLQTSRLSVTKALTREEQEQERKLRAELISLNTQIISISQKEKPDQAKLDTLKPLREQARLNYEAYQTSLYAAHPELKVQRGEAPVIKAEELASLLPDAASTILEYVVTDDVTYLFAITKTPGNPAAAVQAYTLPIKQQELIKQVESLRGQLAVRDLRFRTLARQLYQLLLKPAEAQLRGKTNLVIVPDNKLWELPFQALLAEGAHYVLETKAVSYAPSLTVLREMMAKRRNPGATPAALLALGNPALGREKVARTTLSLRDGKLEPLPEAEQEVKSLGQLYGASRSKVYVGSEAREDRVKTEAARANILHFATHGILNDASPMYSHLVLAQGDKNEDGLLEAWELMQLDLQADLAVLSACETARGRFGAGEGMIGLTWALFVAGVPSTVVSQWKVESASTRDLMLGFHQQMRMPSPKTKAQALRHAALKLMKNPATNHPFYWASFVLVGDAR